VAVFIDGCFWHGCPDHGRRPGTNAKYWNAKLQRNIDRDKRNDAALADAGWTVVRAWEHEEPEAVADRVTKALREAGVIAA
jgi:DNA mismatch endonuclease (patch repair protein)